MIITPDTDPSLYAVGGKYEPIAANFPALKFFLPCAQSEIGAAYLTDSIGGVKLNKSTGTIAAGPDLFSLLPSQSNTGTTITGTLPDPGAGFPMLMAVANPGAAAGFALGDTTNGAYMSLAKAGSIFDAAANGITTTAFTNVSAVVARAIIINSWDDATTTAGHGADIIECLPGGTSVINGPIVATTGLAASSLDGWGTTSQWACASAVLALYSVALFVFTTPPSVTLLKTAVAWMAYQHSIGNKWIYPGLKGVA